MDEDKILEEIRSCIDCKTCTEVCDTFQVTKNELQSPNGRLKIADKIFNNEEISEDERFGIYTCTLCGICDLVCSQNINISSIIHASKFKIVNTPKGIYDIHKKIIQGIMDKNNSVNGNPEERVDWLPKKYKSEEIFDEKESENLLFLGCMSSFRVKESASTSYELLKMGNFDFKILKNEPCCGEYVYSAGKLDLAKKMFQENWELLKNNSIKTIIVTCAGCLYAFNNVYPKYLDDWNVEVKHIAQVVNELEKQGKIKLNPLNKEITYHDSCRMGRKLKNMTVYDEPRELLDKCGLKINELENNRENTPCCGAGSGIRGVDSNLCVNICSKIINEAKTNEIVSSCPLCIFNFRYANYKTQGIKQYIYITDYFLKALKQK